VTMARHARVYAAFVSALWLCANCSFEEAVKQCDVDLDCLKLGADYTCFQQKYCVKPSSSVTQPDSGADAQIPKSGSGGTTVVTSGTGASTSGTGAAGTTNPTGGAGNPGIAGSSSGPECEIPGVVAECDIDPANYATNDGCKTGTHRCEGNTWGPCTATKGPEICNHRDDDCDGTIDEDADEACYPMAPLGCVETPAGSKLYTCKGVCAAGKSICTDGKLQACAGAKTPAAKEICTDAVATDDDCNGMVDDGCVCDTTSPVQECYDGNLTDVIGGTSACRRGTRVCQPTGSSCVNSVHGTPETNANCGIDNDCNGTLDDILPANGACSVPTNKGVCATGTYVCQGAVATCKANTAATEICDGKDNDCDGVPDEAEAGLCAAGLVCRTGKCVAVGSGDDAGT
jgi:Putative metal-binding motif